MYLFGILYLYQALVSMLYTACFIIACLNFDGEITAYCEKIGFIIKSSRQLKFDMLFICLGLFVLMIVLTSAQQINWAEQQIWIINASIVSKAIF